MRVLLFVMLTTLVTTPASAQLARPEAIAAAARRAMEDTGAQGLAIATIDRGRVVSSQVFGARNARGDPLTPQTVMYGASLTKAVFGYFVLQLVDEGRLSLDQPLASYLPRPLPDYGNLDAYGNWGDLKSDPRWRDLTARRVLNHATGFANYSFLEPDGTLRIHFTPGSRYGYSGEGILLLQFVLVEGLKLDIEAELQRRLFGPAGATDTGLIWRPAFARDLADGWDAEGKPHPHDERGRVRASGSMDTSLADMARVAAFMVSGQGLSPRSRAAFARGTLPITTRSQFPTLQPEAPATERPKARAALGVIAFDGPQGPGWFKGGHDDITANTLVCLERTRRCVVVLANDVRAERAFPSLVRAILGETGVPYRWEYPEIPLRP